MVILCQLVGLGQSFPQQMEHPGLQDLLIQKNFMLSNMATTCSFKLVLITFIPHLMGSHGPQEQIPMGLILENLIMETIHSY